MKWQVKKCVQKNNESHKSSYSVNIQLEGSMIMPLFFPSYCMFFFFQICDVTQVAINDKNI
jgi:hypothetical protein